MYPCTLWIHLSIQYPAGSLLQYLVSTTHPSGTSVSTLESGIWNPEYGIRNPEFRIPGSGIVPTLCPVAIPHFLIKDVVESPSLLGPSKQNPTKLDKNPYALGRLIRNPHAGGAFTNHMDWGTSAPRQDPLIIVDKCSAGSNLGSNPGSNLRTSVPTSGTLSAQCRHNVPTEPLDGSVIETGSWIIIHDE